MPSQSRVASLCREVLLDLPNRNARLPELYEVFDHPLHPPKNPGRSIVIKYDIRPIAMKDQKDYEESLEVPLGLFELRAGDYLFCRPGLDNKDHRSDIVIGWVVGPEHHSQACRDALDEAADQALGPKETRNATEVPLERGTERVGTGRCYNIAVTVELPTGCIAPQAAMKPSTKCAQFHKLCRVLSTAIANISMEDMDLAPEDLKNLIRRRTEMLGLPRIGAHRNYAFQTIQCNIAAAKGLASLAAQLASFGEVHFDDKDCPGHFTNMQVASQIPEGWDPGYFHVVGLGVFVALSKHTSFNFQGNRKHGASGPFAPPGTTEQDIPSWAYRFTLISYPPSRMCNQACRYRVAATPGPEPFYLTPEMQNPEFVPPSSVSEVGSANFFRDGHHFMDNKSVVEFALQSLYRECHYFLKQMPAHLGIQRPSPNNFFSDITYLNENGERVAVEPWEWAPPLGGEEEERFLERWRRGTGEWEAHLQKSVSLLPAKSHRSAAVRAESSSGPRSTQRRSATIATPPTASRVPTVTVPSRNNAQAGPGPSTMARANPGPPQKQNSTACWVEIRTPAQRVNKRPHESEGGSHDKRDSQKRARTAGPYTLRPKPAGNSSLGQEMEDGSTESRWGDEIFCPEENADCPSQTSDANSEWGYTGAEGTGIGRKGKGVGRKGKGLGKKGGSGAARVERVHGGKGKGKKSFKKSSQDVVLAEQAYVFRFMNMSDASHLHAELTKVLNGARTLPIDLEVDTSQYDRDYEGAASMIESAPSSLETVRVMSLMTQRSAKIDALLQRTEYDSRQHHKRYAMAKMNSWKWLRSLRDSARVLAKKGRPALRKDTSWLARLVSQLVLIHETGAGLSTISSDTVGFHVSPDEPVDFVYNNPIFYRTPAFVTQKLEACVGDAVVDAVRMWMGWDVLKDVKLGWFIRIVEEHLGEAALTLDYVWAILSSFRPSDVVAGGQTRGGYQFERDTEQFRCALAQHPIMDVSSQEGHLYKQYRDFMNGDISLLDLEIGDIDGGWEKYFEMWRKALAYTRDPNQATDELFIQLLQRDTDFYLPIREKAPGRLRSTSEIGPYRPEIITTPAGIFGAIVWRAITYRSEFSAEHTMTFESSEALTTLVESITKSVPSAAAKQTDRGNHYFCNRMAYGQPTRRSLDHHPAYWDSIQQKAWPKFARANPKATFSSAIKYFQEDKAINSGVFPQLGDLGRLTLTGDLVYAGVVQAPTVLEMAEAIVDLNAGAMSGLRALKFLTKSWPATRRARLEAVAEALQAVQRGMADAFSEEELGDMGFDLLSLEHSLCKFARALRMKAI